MPISKKANDKLASFLLDIKDISRVMNMIAIYRMIDVAEFACKIKNRKRSEVIEHKTNEILLFLYKYINVICRNTMKLANPFLLKKIPRHTLSKNNPILGKKRITIRHKNSKIKSDLHSISIYFSWLSGNEKKQIIAK